MYGAYFVSISECNKEQQQYCLEIISENITKETLLIQQADK